MFSSSKNLSHQQAVEHIQSLFPAVALPSFSSKINLRTILDSVSNSLPIPQTHDHKNVLMNMKTIVDNQQYKIQRNMLQIQDFSQNFQSQGNCLDFYQQRSTAIDFSKKISGQTSGQSVMSEQSEDMWWNIENKHNSQQFLQKQCFSFLD